MLQGHRPAGPARGDKWLTKEGTRDVLMAMEAHLGVPASIVDERLAGTPLTPPTRVSITQKPVKVESTVKVSGLVKADRRHKPCGRKVCIGKIGFGDVGRYKLGTPELSAAQRGACQIGLRERGEFEISARQVSAL
jgi:hypothetical protein